MKKLFVSLMLFTIVIISITCIGSMEEIFAETLMNGVPDNAIGAINSYHRISGSPFLQLPDDMLDVPPAVPPEHAEQFMVAVEDPNAVEIYDVATGETATISSDDFSQLTFEHVSKSPQYEGLLPPGSYLESVLGTDGRTQVTNTTSFPWRTVVYLYIFFPDSAANGCSGAIIDEFHVLTAGHCVYSHSQGGWASSVKVIPGLSGTYMPYNYAWSTTMRTYTAWTVSADHQHDWAVITLDRNIGNFMGWMGLQTAPSSSSIYTGFLNTTGYPADKPSGTMWYDSDVGRTATVYNHWYYTDTSGGQSGSPVWRYDGTDRYILTVHAYGNDGSGSNHGTRLNQDKYDKIPTWVNADIPPADLADLIDDGQSYMGFSPTAVIPGATGFQVWSDVRNVGTASSGGFSVSYYASTDTAISKTDHFICSGYVSSISPFTTKDSSCSGTFPGNIPEGSYRIGSIIDMDGAVSEFDVTNNTAYNSSYELVVTRPEITSPAPGRMLTGPAVTFNWTAKGTPVTQWWLYAGDTGIGSSNIYTASQGASTSKTLSGLPTDGRTVYVRLWYKTEGAWQFEDYQYTACTTTTAAPEITSPAPGSTLNCGDMTFTWTANTTPVNAWWIWAGATQGGQDILNSGDLGYSTSHTISGLPTDRSTVYVRLFYTTSNWSNYQWVDSQFVASGCGS